jgi:hypothetical protein
VALIARRAGDVVSAGANASLTGVSLGAGVLVIAPNSICRIWIRAVAGCRVAFAGDMTLIERGANNVVAANARSGLAGVRLRAGVAVIAGGAVCEWRIRTDTRCGVADADPVALIGRGADDRIAADAFP